MTLDLELVIGPATFTFQPDGDDPGVGTVRVDKMLEPVEGRGPQSEYSGTLPDWSRRDWDSFVQGATL